MNLSTSLKGNTLSSFSDGGMEKMAIESFADKRVEDAAKDNAPSYHYDR